MNGDTSRFPQLWLFQRKHISDPIQKDYLIKRAYVEFICPSGETQIGINHRFNEQDEDEFRLQDKCIYSRGQPSQTKVSRRILAYCFYGLAVVNVGVLIGLIFQTISHYSYSRYQVTVSFVIAILSTFLTLYGAYAMHAQSLDHLTVYKVLNSGLSILLFPLSPTSLYFVHFIIELVLIFLAAQLKYRLDDLWFIPSSNEITGQIVL
ncbi:hypothetical protein WA556_001948 [Blastocystis sp. ATCC 50177/Nand II]